MSFNHKENIYIKRGTALTRSTLYMKARSSF